MRAASLLQLAVLALLPGYAMAQTYRLAGILSSPDGTPIARGHLSVDLLKENGQPVSQSSSIMMDTDDHGRFLIPLPSPGNWKLFASARGFLAASLDEHEGFFTGVILTPAAPSVEVAFHLTPEASITGYVLDEAGEPVRTNGQVTLLMAAEQIPDQAQPRWQSHGVTQTDDRGHYEFPNLGPGRYQVMVQAQPWYAMGATHRFARFGGPIDPGASALPADSSLDMAYPQTWYPGVTDPAAASVLTLQGSDTRQADLRLLPVPSVHLHIPPAPPEEDRRGTNIPQIRQLLPDGGYAYQSLRSTTDAQGGVDIGGLAPGTYEVMSSGGDRPSSVLHIDPGSARLVDLATAVPVVSVTLRFELPEGVTPPSVLFTDTRTGRTIFSGGGDGRPHRRVRVGGVPLKMPGAEGLPGLHPRGEPTVDLVPGRYEVRLAGGQGPYLTGLATTGATSNGRMVTIEGGNPQITLHVAVGRATVTGVASREGKPASGAMVLLVPATLGDPRSFTVLHRDQSNTDGSFYLGDVTPGRYILVAIEHGWPMNWSDPAILSRYLLHGVPIDLTSATALRERIEAQQP